MNQLIGRCSVRGNDSAESAYFSNVPYQRARVDIPDHGNLVAVEVQVRCFRGAPAGSDVREFADDQGFDVGFRRFLIIEIRANVSDVGISQTDNLPGVAGIGENFLVSGEAGVKNDFAAPARDRASRAAVKYAPVLERQNCRSMQNFGQCVLRCSFFLRFGGCR